MNGNCRLQNTATNYCVVFRGGFRAVHKDQLQETDTVYSWYGTQQHAERDISLKKFFRLHN